MIDDTPIDMKNEIIQNLAELTMVEQFTGLAEQCTDLPDWVSIDLSISQLKTIFLLGNSGALTISRIAQLLGLGNPAASILIQHLVEQQLVMRSEDTEDRRRSLVRLTKKGIELISGQNMPRKILLERCLSQMGENELNNLLHGLRSLIAIMRNERLHSK